MSTKTPRKIKTPRERAEETLARAKRRAEKAKTAKAAAQSALNNALAELQDAELRLAYAAKDPALYMATTGTTTTTTETA